MDISVLFIPYFSGCNLSPLLFGLYIHGLGESLNASPHGLPLGDELVSCILFADDMVLTGSSRASLESLMQVTRTFFHAHKLTISITKSKIMSPDPRLDGISFPDLPDQPPLTLDATMSYKYLGVLLNSSTRAAFKDFNATAVKKAQMFKIRALSLSRLGPCRSQLLYYLWTAVALPSILYGSEVLPLTKKTLRAISTCQNTIGKSLLQLPRHASNASVHIDAGFRPIQHVVAERVLRYSQKVMLRPPTTWTKKCLYEHLSLQARSPYYKLLMSHRIDVNSTFPSKTTLSRCLAKKSLQEILLLKQSTISTSMGLTIPLRPSGLTFKMRFWVTDSWLSKVFARFRSGCTGLGNQLPLPDGSLYKLCPLCLRDGSCTFNNELHMLLICPSLSYARQRCVIQAFLASRPGMCKSKVYKQLLDDSNCWPLRERIYSLGFMKTSWNTMMDLEPTYLGV